MAIPPSFIQDLIARADVVEVVGRHVQLKKGGVNMMGLCPFHGEKSPSFSVSPTKQFFHCFGCGKSGNAIGFLMDHLGMSFVEAVEDLAQSMGMKVPNEQLSPADAARAAAARQKQATLTDLLEKAASAYQAQLKIDQRALGYLRNRGLDEATATRFGMGFSPEGWRSLASVFPDYQDPGLVDSGLVIDRQDEETGEQRRYDRFRDRIMFPIRNVKGECIGFGGRVLDKGDPKYLNSPETPVFSKGRELYGLFEARETLQKRGYALVTEGYMDVVALAQNGFPNAVATLGTACTPEHVQKLFRFTDSVVFSFDGDGAGRRAARKALDVSLAYASDTRTVKFLFLPTEHDPDSFIRAHGHDGFERMVATATPLSQFFIDACRDGCELDTLEGRSQFAANAKPLWLQLPEGAFRVQLLNQIGELSKIGAQGLKDLWDLAGQAQLKRYQNYSSGGPPNLSGGLKKPKFADWKAAKAWERDTKGTSAELGGGFTATRVQTLSRADVAARIALGDIAVLEDLSSSQLTMLAELPAPHGALFAWAEAQIHEHGAQPWGALREGLRDTDFESLCLRLMQPSALIGAPTAAATAEEDAPAPSGGSASAGARAATHSSIQAAKNAAKADEVTPAQMAAEQRKEFTGILRLMQIDDLKRKEGEAIARGATEPAMLQVYRALFAERRALEVLVSAAKIT